MDDLTITVKQIGNYPFTGSVGPTDLVLIQQGGLGGAYASITPLDFMGTALEQGGVILFSGTNPENGLAWPNGIGIGYTGGALQFVAPSMGFEGLVNIPSLVIGNSPAASQAWVGGQLESLSLVIAGQVQSFNSRSGDVVLNWSDVYTALGLSPSDPIATVSFVNQQICSATQDFLSLSPFVFTWNGRVGDVFLTATDVSQALFCDPFNSTAPSPALGDSSSRIATTQFVDDSLEDWAAIINNSWNQADYDLLNILQTQYAPLASPALTGVPTAPTPPVNSHDATIATTAFVMNAVTSSVTGVVSFNTRTGAVIFTAADLNSVGGALLASPAFTGTPTVPLPGAGDNSNKIASTAWVLSEISAISAGVTSFNGRSGIVLLQAADLTAVGGALLASPNFSGTPTAPTATTGTNNTQIATTAFVMANLGVASFNGRTGAVTFQANDISAVNGALLASPAFTGAPTAPTAAPGNSTTQLATTAFVAAAVAGASVVASFNTRTGAVVFTAADLASVNGATLSQGTTPPASPTAQSFWYDTTGGQLYVYTGSVWAAASTAH